MKSENDCPCCKKEYDPYATGDKWYAVFDCEYPDTCWFDGYDDPPRDVPKEKDEE